MNGEATAFGQAAEAIAAGGRAKIKSDGDEQYIDYPVVFVGEPKVTVRVRWSSPCHVSAMLIDMTGLPSIVHDEQGETFLIDLFPMWHFSYGCDTVFRGKVIDHSPVWKALDDTLIHHKKVMGWQRTARQLLPSNP